MFPVSFLFKL